MRLFNVKSPASRLHAPAFQEQTLITLRAAEHVGNVPFPNGFGAAHLQMSGPPRRRRAPPLILF